MALELTITLKDSERTYRQKFLHYGQLSVGPDEDDPAIMGYIAQCRKDVQGEIEDVVVLIRMVYQ